MKGLLLAIQFLTIIPVRIRGTISERQIGGSGVFFPLVGVLQGLVASLGVLVLIKVFPPEVVSGLVMLLLIATNGGFHLDGLADTFDALAVKSTGDSLRDRQKRLSVMKDSATGAIGVTAIVMAILLKYLLINSLFQKHNPEGAAYLLFLMPVFSKWAMIPVMAHGRPARDGGLGKMFIDGTGLRAVILSSLLLVAIYFAATIPSGFLTVSSTARLLCLSGLLLYAVGFLWSFFCGRKFGGLTGDTTGAAAEVADLLFLAVAALSLRCF
jgi:adenosylcobinamide-GDP ribazoletransferase